MKINQQKTVEVEAKTLAIHIKIRDEFGARLLDQDGEEIYEWDDTYVPGFMPGDHCGDYLILDIDIETGQITNWRKPTPEQLMECMEKRA